MYTRSSKLTYEATIDQIYIYNMRRHYILRYAA